MGMVPVEIARPNVFQTQGEKAVNQPFSRFGSAGNKSRSFATSFSILAFSALISINSALADSGEVRIDIPSQDLAAALKAFGQQAHIQLLYASETVKGARTDGVTGNYTPEQALKLLLRGTGFFFQATGDNTFTVKPAPRYNGESSSLPEVVVTATKTEAKITEVPVNVTVITAEQIRQQEVKDLSDLLRKEAGVDITRSSPSGVATVSLRGGDSAAQRSVVLIDGQPADFITTGVGGRTAIQLVDPNNVERIEVVRGAGSALYGPGAMGGVVNVITKKGRADKPETRVFIGGDALPSRTAGVSTSGGGKDVTYQFNAKWLDSNGYKAIPEPTPVTQQLNLQNVTWRDKSLGGRIGYWLTDRNELAFSLNHLDTHNNDFGRPNTWATVKSTVYGLDSSNWIRDNYLLTANVSYRDHQGDYDFDSFLSTWNPDTTKTDILREKATKLTAEVKNQWDINSSNRLLFGAAYAKDTADLKYWDAVGGTQNDSRTADVKNLGVYLQDEIRAGDKLFITAGVRYDRFDYALQYTNYTTAPTTAREVNKDWSTFNPRLAARYNITEVTSLRASAGKGFRAPDTYGLMGQRQIPGVLDFRPNPDLNAEKSVNYDIGIDQQFGSGLSASLTAYRSEIKDAIVTMMRPEAGFFVGVIQFQNIGEVHNTGLELELKKKFDDNWSAYGNYTYNVSEISADAPAGAIGWPEKGRKLNLSPVNKLAAGVVYTLPKRLTARLDGRYVGDRYVPGDTQNSPQNKLPSYFVADAKLTWYIPVNQNRMEISAGARNLFDRKYSTRFIGEYEQARTVFVQLGYSLF